MGFWSAGLDQGLRSNPELPHHIRQKKHTSETRGKISIISGVKKYIGVRYKCEYCPKTFTTVTDRERHTSVHTGVYRFSCHVCGKGFNRNDHLDKHYKLHR